MATTILKGTKIEQIFYKGSDEIGTTASTYALNWQDYDILILQACLFANPRETCVVPRIYFESTNSGNRPIIYSQQDTAYFEVWQNGEGSISALSSKSDSNFRLKIFGIKFK